MLLYNSAICHGVNLDLLRLYRRHRFRRGLPACGPADALAAVRAGRPRQKWSTGRTLGVTLLAGLGHVGLTILLGLGLVVAGLALAAPPGRPFHWVVGALMVAVGLFYIARGRHNHALPEAGRAATPPTARRSSPWSPC
jgi:hypothetical protein